MHHKNRFRVSHAIETSFSCRQAFNVWQIPWLCASCVTLRRIPRTKKKFIGILQNKNSHEILTDFVARQKKNVDNRLTYPEGPNTQYSIKGVCSQSTDTHFIMVFSHVAVKKIVLLPQWLVMKIRHMCSSVCPYDTICNRWHTPSTICRADMRFKVPQYNENNLGRKNIRKIIIVYRVDQSVQHVSQCENHFQFLNCMTQRVTRQTFLASL